MAFPFLRQLLNTWPEAAWYVGHLGHTVRVNGCNIKAPTQHLAGVIRLGGYEAPERRALRDLPADLPLIELGAGIGLVACVANRRLRRPADHICVDGNPRALALAADNGRANGCQFRTLHAALAYDTATVTFGMDENIVDGGIKSSHEPVTVPAVTLAGLFELTGFDRCALVCDIEGAEADLVTREGDLLRARVPFLILETHPGIYGQDGERRVHATLGELGYQLIRRERTVSAWRRA